MHPRLQETHHQSHRLLHGSSDDLVQNFVEAAPPADASRLQRRGASIVRAGLAEPLNSPISFLPATSPKLLALSRANGPTFGVPHVGNPLLCDTPPCKPPIPGPLSGIPNSKAKSRLGSLNLIWPRNFSATTSPIPRCYNLSDDQLAAVKQSLELKPNIRKIWSTGGELPNLFEIMKSSPVWLAARG
jgi:putative spermidine/putrescine transport system substrate-binding protein/spermidine/putrescine transport system substrate-binding protein